LTISGLSVNGGEVELDWVLDPAPRMSRLLPNVHRSLLADIRDLAPSVQEAFVAFWDAATGELAPHLLEIGDDAQPGYEWSGNTWSSAGGRSTGRTAFRGAAASSTRRFRLTAHRFRYRLVLTLDTEPSAQGDRDLL
jgi:hypothetical protein